MNRLILSLLLLSPITTLAQGAEATKRHTCVMAITNDLVFRGHGRTLAEAKTNVRNNCWNRLTAMKWSWNAKVMGCTYAFERNMACRLKR